MNSVDSLVYGYEILPYVILADRPRSLEVFLVIEPLGNKSKFHL